MCKLLQKWKPTSKREHTDHRCRFPCGRRSCVGKRLAQWQSGNLSLWFSKIRMEKGRARRQLRPVRSQNCFECELPAGESRVESKSWLAPRALRWEWSGTPQKSHAMTWRTGYRQVSQKLRRMLVNHKRVPLLMRDDSLLAVQPKSFVVTADSNHDLEVSERLPERHVDGVWNLVLALPRMQPQFGKSSRLPAPKFLESLHTRNEFFIPSHHPLRESFRQSCRSRSGASKPPTSVANPAIFQ